MVAQAGNQIGRLARRRVYETIDALCQCGAGLEAITGPLCKLIGTLIGAAALSAFWLDESGAPGGFFHETAPVDLKDLFANRFEELFSGPGQENFVTVLNQPGPLIGSTLSEEYLERFWRSNIYRLLCVPLGHHFLLDLRVDHAGQRKLLLLAWNGPDDPFTKSDVAALEPVLPMLEHTVGVAYGSPTWIRAGPEGAYFIVNKQGDSLLSIDAGAEALLQEAHLIERRISLISPVMTAPSFARQLAASIVDAGASQLTIPIATGRLVFEARPTRFLGHNGADETQIFVSVVREVALEVAGILHLASCNLSPLQRRIALFGMLGGERGDCCDEFQISTAALKKHSAKILNELNVNRWKDLPILARSTLLF